MECGIGNVAAVWDGKVAGMARGLAKVRREKKVLILADSKAAIAAVRKAGRTGKAKSWRLREVVNTIAEVREEGGEVKLGWVKAHMGILGNEAAQVVAKRAAEEVRSLEDHEKWISGGGHKAVGQTEKEGEHRGGRRGWHKEGDRVAAEGGNELLPTTRSKGHRKVVE